MLILRSEKNFAKGQLISKCPFGVFKSSKRTTKFEKSSIRETTDYGRPERK